VRFLFALVALCLAAVTGRAALPRLAYFGALKGALNIPALPPLAWTLEAAPKVAHKQIARFTLTGEGVVLRATITDDATSGIVSWRIDEGRVQLASWAGALAARYAPAAGPVSATGEIILSGEGVLDDFQPTGRLTLRFADATVRNETAGWTLDGVSFSGNFSLAPGFSIASADPFEFGIHTISTSRLGARAFSMRGRLESLDSVAIENARIEIAGGEVEADPFIAPLSPLSVDTRVHIKRIGLQDFAQLIPSGLANARGRLDGDLSFAWTPVSGFKLGIGNLSLYEFEPTVLRLAPSPGFLTSHIPARFEFLPGALGRWLSIRNEVYDNLRDIELGHTDLRVNKLSVNLTPAGDSEGRTASVFMDAGPVDPDSAVKQVIFNVNVSGPLSRLVGLPANGTVSFDVR
jgi:hypothetical protein